MRFLSVLFLLWSLSVVSSSSAEEDKIIRVKTNEFVGYILTKEYANEHLKDSLAKDGVVFWTPSNEQVIAANTAFKNLILGSPEGRIKAFRGESGSKYFEGGISYMQKNYKSYLRRFIGTTVNGNKQIVCYFLTSDKSGDISYAIAGPFSTDRGADFWGGKYDVASKSCSGLWMDGNG